MAATLEKIRTKIRRLTRSLSDNQITDNQIDEYVDDFVLYDFPEHLRLMTLHNVFTWVCDPYIDTYTTDANASVNALVNFNNNYITTNSPIYINGNPAYFSLNETEFYAQFPLTKNTQLIAQGDGATLAFTATISAVPIAQNSVVVSAIDVTNNKLSAVDSPIDTETGNLVDPETDVAIGTINYITGAITITFVFAPKNNSNVDVQFLPYTAGLPTSLLYFENKFVLRPIPSRPYEIRMEVYKRPTSMGNSASASPELTQWWQYIAYGAAKKILEDRSDDEGVLRIMPEFKKQETLVLRRTIVQQSMQRSATIYQFQTGLDAAPWDFGNRNF